jgi:hypothetical protein
MRLETAVMLISNEDRSPVEAHRCNAAPRPTGFAEIVSDIHASQSGCCSSPAPASNHLFGDVSVAMTTSAAVYSIAKHGVQASERITPREPATES